MVADIWLFASMNLRVYSQSATLNEAFVAVLYTAIIGPLLSVYPIVTAEIRLVMERLREKSY
jgi:hypothetical protein